MVVRNYATVVTEFADDGEWDDSGNMRIPGGRQVGAHFREMLRRHGFPCSELSQHSFYGWEFVATTDTVAIWCLIQPGHLGADSWLFILDRKTSLIRRLIRSDEASFKESLITIHNILINDRKVSRVLWHTQDEYDHGPANSGATTPIPTE
jgi:hypothetical protein